jgi:hypothetical protein
MSDKRSLGHGSRFGPDAEFYRLRQRLRIAVGALILVTMVGVLGFVLIGGDLLFGVGYEF